MAKNDFKYGGWNSYTLRCGAIMTVISPGDCTLQCGMWLWNRDSEFTKWQHTAMWHVALESWHWIRQVAAPCNMAGGSGMTCHSIRTNVRYIRILHLVAISTTLPQSTCHFPPVTEILSKLDHPRQKKWRHFDVMSIFKMADLRHLGFYGSNNGFFEKPYDFL